MNLSPTLFFVVRQGHKKKNWQDASSMLRLRVFPLRRSSVEQKLWLLFMGL
jgi:hypothetical protein